jgi:hypothetical protein
MAGLQEAEAQQQEQEHEQEAPAGSNTGYQAKRQRQGRRPGSPPAAPVLQDAAHDEGGGVQVGPQEGANARCDLLWLRRRLKHVQGEQ